MKTVTKTNALELYLALSAANIAISSMERETGPDFSKYRKQITELKDQIQTLNTTGNVVIIMGDETI